jgi:hypothetical protein
MASITVPVVSAPVDNVLAEPPRAILQEVIDRAMLDSFNGLFFADGTRNNNQRDCGEAHAQH